MRQVQDASIYQLRKEHSLCTQCGGPAADDSSLCAPHRDAARARKAQWIARERRRRRRARVCGDCGAPLKSAETIWCHAHRVRRNRLSKLRRGVDSRVDRSERVAARTITHADGRTRYHGQSRRGQQTHEQLDAQDLGLTREALEAAETGLQLYRGAEVQAMPRIQREDVRAAAVAQLGRAIRHIEDIQERHGHFRRRHGERD